MQRRNKEELVSALGEAFRAAQNTNQVFDQTVTRCLGINQTDLLAMDLLERKGRITAGELAREMGLTTGAVTSVVDRLERKGYAQRIRDEADRRRVLVELTQKAREEVGKIFGPLAEDWREYMSRRTTAELELILDFMRGANQLVVCHVQRVMGGDGRRPARSDRAGREK